MPPSGCVHQPTRAVEWEFAEEDGRGIEEEGEAGELVKFAAAGWLVMHHDSGSTPERSFFKCVRLRRHAAIDVRLLARW